MGQISDFMLKYYKHYNAGTTVDAAKAWKELADKKKGTMMITLAGAFSTGEGGKMLAQLIRADKIGCISCTGANLEEDIFNLIGRPEYKRIPNYADLTKKDEKKIYDSGRNRVTDTTIPDEVMQPVQEIMTKLWKKADKKGERYFPHELLWEALPLLEKEYKIPREESWMIAAMEKKVMMVVPGWEDSTLGNHFAALCILDEIKNPTTAKDGVEYMIELSKWYAKVAEKRPVGFFQIGGGIAGDFPICVVPMLYEELKQDDLSKIAYFCQITDSDVSYGGYSGAVPNEKITWGKLDTKTPSFNIKSDASIVFPLIAAYVLDL